MDRARLHGQVPPRSRPGSGATTVRPPGLSAALSPTSTASRGSALLFNRGFFARRMPILPSRSAGMTAKDLIETCCKTILAERDRPLAYHLPIAPYFILNHTSSSRFLFAVLSCKIVPFSLLRFLYYILHIQTISRGDNLSLILLSQHYAF